METRQRSGPTAKDLLETTAARIQLLAPILAPFAGSESEADEAIAKLGFSTAQARYARSWVSGDLTLVKPKLGR